MNEFEKFSCVYVHTSVCGSIHEIKWKKKRQRPTVNSKRPLFVCLFVSEIEKAQSQVYANFTLLR